MSCPSVLGSLACHLRDDCEIAQQHRDGRELDVVWRECAGYWRCTIFISKATDLCVAQIDIHDDGTIRLEAHEPISVTIDPDVDVLVLVRLGPAL